MLVSWKLYWNLSDREGKGKVGEQGGGFGSQLGAASALQGGMEEPLATSSLPGRSRKGTSGTLLPPSFYFFSLAISRGLLCVPPWLEVITATPIPSPAPGTVFY
jgi:hypothetical protein